MLVFTQYGNTKMYAKKRTKIFKIPSAVTECNCDLVQARIMCKTTVNSPFSGHHQGCPLVRCFRFSKKVFIRL